MATRQAAQAPSEGAKALRSEVPASDPRTPVRKYKLHIAEADRMKNVTLWLPKSLVDDLKRIAGRDGKRYQMITRQVLLDFARTQLDA